MSALQNSNKLTNLQLELLKLYAYRVSDLELQDIRKLLANYFAAKIDTEMDELWEEKGWNEQTIEKWKNEDLHHNSSQNQ
jgi:hypothetical protein